MVKTHHRTSTSISSSRGRRRARETRGPMMISMTMTTRSGTSSTRRRRSSARTLARASPCVVHIARASSSERRASSSSSSRRMKTRRGVRDAIRRYNHTKPAHGTRALDDASRPTAFDDRASLYRHPDHRHRRSRGVAGVGRRAFDRLDDFRALDHASEHRVLTRR